MVILSLAPMLDVSQTQWRFHLVINIQGKDYTSKFISLFQLQKAIALGGKHGEAETKWLDNPNDEALATAYKQSWTNYCEAFIEGDVKGLSLEVITPLEGKEIRDFFYSVVEKVATKLKESEKSSQDSSPS